MNDTMSPLHGIYLLLESLYTKSHKDDLLSIIELNHSGLKKDLEKFVNTEFFELTDIPALEKLNEDDKNWQKPTTDNLKRKAMLSKLLPYKEAKHVEMLQMGPLRELVSVK